MGGWNASFNLFYTAKSVVDAGTNSFTKRLALLDESGNSSFPGSITATSFSGNGASLTSLNASNISSGTIGSDRLPTVPVNKGGTGLTTLTSGQVLIGNGTGNVTFRAIDATTGGTSESTSLITSGAVYAGLATKANTHSHPYLNTGGGTLSGNIHFTDNKGIIAIMGGGSDGWGIVGSGTSDNGRLKIYVQDNATSDWIDFEFRDYTGNIYTPLSMTGNQILFSSTSRPTVNDTYNLGTSSYKWANMYATTFHGALDGNSSTTSKLATARTITLSGAVTGSVDFDGSGNVTLSTSVNHNHTSINSLGTKNPQTGRTQT